MKTIVSIFFLILLSYTFSLQAQTVGNPAQEPTFAPEALQEDLDSLVSYLIQTHPNPFGVYPKASFDEQFRIIRQSITQPLTASQFFRLAAPLVANLKDGHTGLGAPIDFLTKQDISLFPYTVNFSLKAPYIRVKLDLSTSESLPAGTEIISINGITSEEIVGQIVASNSGENPAFRLDRASDLLLGFQLALYFDMKGPVYKLEYRHEGKSTTINIDGRKLAELKQAEEKQLSESAESSQPDYFYSLLPEKNTAILTMRNMDGREEFRIFLEEAFSSIAQNNIQNVILDFRNNGGGDSGLGDELFQYISKEPYTQFSKTSIKYSRLQKALFKRMCEMESSQCSTYDYISNKSNGQVETFASDKLIPIREDIKPFTGKVYLLTSVGTFSSAASFAQCFSHYKMGTIVGEETGGWIISYGDLIRTLLPNSKLLLFMSHKKFEQVGATENDLFGTYPNIAIQQEEALEYTMVLISNEK